MKIKTETWRNRRIPNASETFSGKESALYDRMRWQISETARLPLDEGSWRFGTDEGRPGVPN